MGVLKERLCNGQLEKRIVMMRPRHLKSILYDNDVGQVKWNAPID